MGTIIKFKDYEHNRPSGLLRPLIYCNGHKPDNTVSASINIELAKRLISVRPGRRSMRIEPLLTEILEPLPDNTVIQDFDVMFNPEYKIDVLRILITVCKKKPFDVVWPGLYEDGKLYYSEDGHPDYKVFLIDDYDVTCIV